MSALVGSARSIHAPRAILAAVTCLTVAFLVQTAVLPALGLWPAVPVVLSTVCLLSLVLGSRSGAIIGFLAGLLLDLTSSGVLGVGALIGALLGATVGTIRTDRWIWSGALRVWLLTCLAAGGMQLIDALALGTAGSLWIGALWTIGGSLICTVALLPARRRLQAVVR